MYVRNEKKKNEKKIPLHDVQNVLSHITLDDPFNKNLIFGEYLTDRKKTWWGFSDYQNIGGGDGGGCLIFDNQKTDSVVCCYSN